METKKEKAEIETFVKEAYGISSETYQSETKAIERLLNSLSRALKTVPEKQTTSLLKAFKNCKKVCGGILSEEGPEDYWETLDAGLILEAIERGIIRKK